MGRLSGFKYREVARKMRALGWVFDRPGPGSHEVWRHSASGKKVTLPHHAKDMAEGTLRAILRENDLKKRRWRDCAFARPAQFLFPTTSSWPRSPWR
jgi:predicted RNA binding protein YcfA (HicA-like mRNA interferase family)